MSLLVRSDREARELSHTLREGGGPGLRRRRQSAALTLGAIGAMGTIAAYQLGLIRHLPDPPLPHFDASKVDSAPQAYRYGSVPDAVVGLGSYAVTLGLIAMGGADRVRRHPWIPLALTAKSAVDVANAAKLSVDQWTEHRAFCAWCLAAAGATFATLPLTLPEAREAWRALRG